MPGRGIDIVQGFEMLSSASPALRRRISLEANYVIQYPEWAGASLKALAVFYPQAPEDFRDDEGISAEEKSYAQDVICLAAGVCSIATSVDHAEVTSITALAMLRHMARTATEALEDQILLLKDLTSGPNIKTVIAVITGAQCQIGLESKNTAVMANAVAQFQCVASDLYRHLKSEVGDGSNDDYNAMRDDIAIKETELRQAMAALALKPPAAEASEPLTPS